MLLLLLLSPKGFARVYVEAYAWDRASTARPLASMSKRTRGNDGEASSVSAPFDQLRAAIDAVSQGIEGLLAPLVASIQDGGSLMELQSKLVHAANAAKEGVDAEADALDGRKAALDQEIVLMQQSAVQPGDVITLNIGGTCGQPRLDTPCQQSEHTCSLSLRSDDAGDLRTRWRIASRLHRFHHVSIDATE